MKRRAKAPWRAPAEAQAYDGMQAGQRIQIIERLASGREGRARIIRAGKADWSTVTKWRFR